jgi:hypothetical protein
MKNLATLLRGKKSCANFHKVNVDTRPGLPDGIFSYQFGKFWHILEDLGIKNFDNVHIDLVFFVAICFI